jgi:hypothetical protein
MAVRNAATSCRDSGNVLRSSTGVHSAAPRGRERAGRAIKVSGGIIYQALASWWWR